MEEHVGQLWHRLITRAARTQHPDAAITLAEAARSAGALFRALGGAPSLKLEAAGATRHGARRGWLQRIAGSGDKVELAWSDAQSLRLPERIAVFPERALNRDLYLWLAALAAVDAPPLPWFLRSQWQTLAALARSPGFLPRYRRLVAAQLALRPQPQTLRADEAAQEHAIRMALLLPGSVTTLPPARREPQPVYLWLHPRPPRAADGVDPASGDDAEQPAGGNVTDPEDRRRRRAERVDMPNKDGGLLAVRMENIFSWAEYVKVDRGTEDGDDAEAARAADDLDVMSVARDASAAASRLRFDLDLPSAANDDTPLGPGILLPEWDWRKSQLLADHCRIQPMVAARAEPCELPAHLRRTAQRLRRQFQALANGRSWQRGQQDGSEIDLDAWLLHETERAAGRTVGERGLYRQLRNDARDLACLLLADLSLSTDAHIDNHARVIDVIRDSLFLFAESLAATGDRFAMYGFSSRRRNHVRVHTLKEFDEAYGGATRGRLEALKPGFYTRMGAAIRHATALLEPQRAGQRLLLLLTDGKPNDLDRYEGRYGVEDTRMALIEARRRGLQPFCVTIDERAGDYLPYLFGNGAFVVIRRPSDLPRELPLLYARLTRQA